MYVCMIPDRVLLSLCYLVTFFSFWFSVEGTCSYFLDWVWGCVRTLRTYEYDGDFVAYNYVHVMAVIMV